ncbi:MAG: hypothetical protein AAF762_13780 [Pseudomonadota bacterium]
MEEFAIRTRKNSSPYTDDARLFYLTGDTAEGKGFEARDDALADPPWQSLSAIQAGTIHEVSDSIWNTAGGIIADNLMLDDIARIYGLE